MGKPYSQDLRERVLGPIDNGENVYEIVPRFNLSVSYIYKILARRRTTGETTARPQRHGPLPKLAPYNDNLRTQGEVEAVPDTTLDELRAWLLSEHKIEVSNSCNPAGTRRQLAPGGREVARLTATCLIREAAGVSICVTPLCLGPLTLINSHY
jgi:transposase